MISRREHQILLFAILFIGILSVPAWAEPSLKIEPTPSKISETQTATLTLKLEWPASEDPYEIHSLEPKCENLILVDQRQSQETGPKISHTITYVFNPIKKGSALIYPFEISYRKSDTDPWSPLLVPEQKIIVVSNAPLQRIFTGLILLCALAGAGFAAIKFGKTLKARKSAQNRPATDPKQRIYANAEEAIATFASPDAKTKIAYWANQLRTVVSVYYDVPAGTGSSAALLDFVRSKGLPAGERNEVSRLFEEMNEMQFSREDLPRGELDRVQKTLLQYVKGKIIIENSDS